MLGPILAAALRILFVGINPSLRSTEVGHHFARPGNRFWPTLHAAGVTPRLLRPDEDAEPPSYRPRAGVRPAARDDRRAARVGAAEPERPEPALQAGRLRAPLR